MTAAHPLVQPLIDDLHEAGRLRVWSLVVTILGDVVQPRGGVISMSDLLALTGHVGIDQGAIRTALSRLSKDGWVQGQRNGRTSSYGFGSTGQASFAPAARRIYAPVDDIEVGGWVLAVLPPQRAANLQEALAQLRETGAFLSGSGVGFWPQADAPDPEVLDRLDCLVFRGGPDRIPGWVRDGIAPADVAEALQAFHDRITHLLPLPADLAGIDALAARILLIHDWRRLVLRCPPIPAVLQPPDWPGPRAHRVAADAYRALWPVSEGYWQTPLSASGRAMLEGRF